MLQRKWGVPKRNAYHNLLKNLLIADINKEDVIDKYAEIDAFSNGKSDVISLGTSARNMGKNDLWIAATASVLKATLLTTDQDFSHLNRIYLNVDIIPI
jgi:tRNA(fMet)-specific endonuclease VapC